MSDDEGKVRHQVMLEPNTAAKVDELAGLMRLSRSQFLAVLIEEGMKEDEWAIRVATSRFVAPVSDAVKRWREGDGGGADHGEEPAVGNE